MRISVLALVSLVGCGGSTAGIGGGGDGGPEGNPCEGVGCASEGPSVTFQVTDAVTGTPISNPTFSENGQATGGNCAVQTGAPCSAFQVFYSPGHHVVTVSAPGYAPQNETFDLAGPTGCCGRGQQLGLTVALVPYPDAGSTDGGAATCSSNAQCNDGSFFELCFPGGVVTGCPICVQPNPACKMDTDCSTHPGTVCDLAPCTCGGQLSCVPACAPGASCGAGLTCQAGHCISIPCTTDGNCPANFKCGTTSQCIRRGCASDADCGGVGYCVNQSCYDQPGKCEPAPA